MIGVNNVIPKDFNKTFTSGLVEINLSTNLFESAPNDFYVLEWIPYERLTNVKYLDKRGFSTVYKAIWLDNPILKWDYEKQQWKRWTKKIINVNSDKDENDSISKIEGDEVVLKNLDNSSNLNDEFLNEWKYHYNCCKSGCFIRLYGITQDPNNLVEMIQLGNLIHRHIVQVDCLILPRS